jgi:ribosomal-protein-alanine N-acetyltransferase
MTPHGKSGFVPSLVRKPDPDALAAVDAQVFGVSWSSDEFSRMLANPAIGAWLMREGNWDIGYVCFQRVGHEAEIHRIAVLSTWQGRGYGRWLLDRFLDWARLQRVSRVLLEVREGNRPALALYETAGFRIAERRRRYFTAPPEDALVMERRLPVKPHPLPAGGLAPAVRR